MSLTNELERMQALHDSGTLTDAEFADAKAKVLAESQPSATVPAGSVQRELRRLQLQNEVLSLDQNWSVERGDYLFHGRYGYTSIPTKSSGVNGALAMVAVCLLLILWGVNTPKGGEVITLGVIGIFAAVWLAIYTFSKADAYEVAYEQYQQERRDLTDQLAALGD